MSNGEETNEVFAIKYATRTGPKSREFHCFHLYAADDNQSSATEGVARCPVLAR